MGKLLDRLRASVTHGNITDVVEEWNGKNGEVGVYGAVEDGKRVFVAAARIGSQVKANRYTHLEIQNVLSTIRVIAEVFGAKPVVQPKPPSKPETPPAPTLTIEQVVEAARVEANKPLEPIAFTQEMLDALERLKKQ